MLNPSTASVIVIGGGLAGCTAALALARSGRTVTLVESKTRLGGRAGSYTDQASGQSIDYCQHVGMVCCTALQQLISWLDQRDEWHVQRELFFYGPTGQAQTLRALPYLPAPAHLLGWLLRWPGLKVWERLRIAQAMMALDRIALPSSSYGLSGKEEGCETLSNDRQALSLDQQSALQWLTARGQSPAALERFWSTIIVSALGEELSRVSLSAMVQLFQDGFLRRRDAYQLLIPKRPLDELFGTRFHQALVAAGVNVRTGSSVQRLHWEGANCRSVTLLDGTHCSADRYVMAVPWHAVERLVANCPDESLRCVGSDAGQLQASPISGVHTWWDRPWLPTPHAVLVDRLCQWIFAKPESYWPATRPLYDSNTANETADVLPSRVETSQAPRHASETYYQIVISASRMLPRGDGAAVRRLIEEDLRAVFPAARSANLLRIKVVTDPQAVFSIAPGTMRLRPHCSATRGNLYWAGDWVRTGWPSTMESAVRSGIEAARVIVQSPRSR